MIPIRLVVTVVILEPGMSYKEYAKLKEARTKVDKMAQKIWYVLRKMIVEDGLREDGLR